MLCYFLSKIWENVYISDFDKYIPNIKIYIFYLSQIQLKSQIPTPLEIEL